MDKKNLSEEDIKRLYITPHIEKKWDREHIRMEMKITDGRVNIRGNMAFREKPKKADYVLYYRGYYPLAIVEAKANHRLPSFGLQQAKEYCLMMDVKFAYSSNGDSFVEHDFLTGKERNLPLEDFPTADDLMERLRKEGKLNDTEIKVINQPFYTSQNTYPPRYYQQVAIDRTLDAIARGEKRILLVMATGTGKTYTSFQIVYRLKKSGLKKKILYLADRNILVDHSIIQDFSTLSKVIHKVDFAKDNPSTVTAYEVYFALYQQMVGNDDVPHFQELFDPEFFDLVIVDECHRGSAKEESRWRKVLEYFRTATQIGMTATPKETKYTSNISYFGKPVYEYSLKQGINDGFLAPFRVIEPRMNISDGWRPFKGQRDYYGNEIEDRIYDNSDYDYNIVLEDRIREVAEQITAYLSATDPMSKTIVFCASEDAAERMRQALAICNEDRMKENPDYVVRITGSDQYGKGKLNYFISVNSPYPVIATTSELLSTGVDCKMVKLIAIDKTISSMTTFKQIVGRGTRIRESDGKTSFTIMDFRMVTRLFSDPEWDGPIDIQPGFTGGKGVHEDPAGYDPTGTGEENGGKDGDDGDGGGGERIVPIIRPDSCRVFTTTKTISIYDTDGKLLKQENIIDYTRTNIHGEYGDLSKFIHTWTDTEKKAAISDALAHQGIDLDKLKQDMKMDEVDDFDFICHVAYDQKPLTRKERANNVKKRDFLHRFAGAAKEVLETLLDKYMNLGIKEIENTTVLKLEEFKKFGTPSKIAKLFGGKEGYKDALRELENEIYKEDNDQKAG
ncbi:MAG TPA: restriction endonuclease subunit R [Selenomonas sp.]|nr:restriction endonuclease subunit R [Selenomonas sp.]